MPLLRVVIVAGIAVVWYNGGTGDGDDCGRIEVALNANKQKKTLLRGGRRRGWRCRYVVLR